MQFYIFQKKSECLFHYSKCIFHFPQLTSLTYVCHCTRISETEWWFLFYLCGVMNQGSNGWLGYFQIGKVAIHLVNLYIATFTLIHLKFPWNMGIIHIPKQSHIHINKSITIINHHLCNKIVPFGLKVIVIFNKNIIRFCYGIVNAINLAPITKHTNFRIPSSQFLYLINHKPHHEFFEENIDCLDTFQKIKTTLMDLPMANNSLHVKMFAPHANL